MRTRSQSRTRSRWRQARTWELQESTNCENLVEQWEPPTTFWSGETDRESRVLKKQDREEAHFDETTEEDHDRNPRARITITEDDHGQDHGEMKRGDEWNKANLYPKHQLLDAEMRSRGKPFSKLSTLKVNKQKPFLALVPYQYKPKSKIVSLLEYLSALLRIKTLSFMTLVLSNYSMPTPWLGWLQGITYIPLIGRYTSN